MARLRLFYRLIVRPLLHEPVRLGLMVLAVALGVAVVLAIALAGNAATGSFHSSMETLEGNNELEVVAAGGVPEHVFAEISTEPYPIQVTARMEDFAELPELKETLPLIGLDLIGEGSRFLSAGTETKGAAALASNGTTSLSEILAPDSIWVGESLKKTPGDTLELLVNDRAVRCT
ncbi:MAG: hypothetical protein ACRD4Y_03905, partial [Candidatus Acidiferrales bacterium]